MHPRSTTAQTHTRRLKVALWLAATILAPILIPTLASAQSPDQMRAICKDAPLQQKMLGQRTGNQRAALEIELEARCAFVELPTMPVHDTADASPGASHTGWVLDARYSADGRQIVSGGRDGMARLWDAGTGKPIRQMNAAEDYQVEAEIRGGQANAVRFVGDGKRIAAAGSDARVRLIDAATGKLVASRPVAPKQPAGLPGAIATTSTGLLLVGGHQADVEAIDSAKSDANAMAVRYRLPGHGAVATAIAVSEPADMIATAASDTAMQSGQTPSVRVLLWRLSTGDKLAEFVPEGDSRVSVLTFSRDGAQLAIVRGGNIHIWAVAEKRVTQTLKFPSTSTPFGVAFTADGAGLISCTTHPILWDIASGKRVRHFGPFMDLCHSVDVSPDGKYVVTTAMNSDLRVWEIATGTFYRRIGRVGPKGR